MCDEERVKKLTRDIKNTNTNIVNEISKDLGLSFRTIRGARAMVRSDESIENVDLYRILQKEFYTMKNMIYLANEGLTDLIPSGFYENEEFLEKTGIDKLPTSFMSGSNDITAFNVRKQIKKIGAYAFRGCPIFEDIIIEGNSLIEIGDYAMADCPNFKTGFLPDSVKRIGEGAYKACTGLTGFCIPKKIYDIRKYTFEDCRNLENVSTERKVRIDEAAFKNCQSLTSISGVVGDLGKDAFNGCSALDYIELDATIINEGALLGCTKIKSISFRKIPVVFGRNCLSDNMSNVAVTVDGFTYQFREAEMASGLIGLFHPKEEINVETYDSSSKISVHEILQNTPE